MEIASSPSPYPFSSVREGSNKNVALSAHLLKTAKLVVAVACFVFAYAWTPPLFMIGMVFGALLSKKIYRTGVGLSNYLNKTWNIATGHNAKSQDIEKRITAWLKVSLYSMAFFCSLPAILEFYIFCGAAYFTAKEIRT